MKLYLKAGACSLSPHIVLEEAGLKYETETVDLQKKVTDSGQDYLQVNPKGYVPALKLDNGQVLTEGPAIVQFLADQVPDRKLAPPNGSAARYELQSWLTFIGTEIHKSFGAFFNPATPEEWKKICRANLERRIAYTAQQLAGKDYLLGQDFSVADAYLFTVLNWAKFIDLDLAQWPEIVAYQARVAARPAVIAALKAEGLA